MAKIDKKSEKAIAAKILEASGLLLLVKPLCKRAGTLTKAEEEVMTKAAFEAASLLTDARSTYWKAEDEAEKAQQTSKMVRPNGGLLCDN